MHALYGFARYADEIVDVPGRDDATAAAQLKKWGDAFLADVRRGRSTDSICAAVVDTVRRWDIPIEHFEAFLHSMAMDLTVANQTYDDLYEYVWSAASSVCKMGRSRPSPAAYERPRFGVRVSAGQLRPRRR